MSWAPSPEEYTELTLEETPTMTPGDKIALTGNAARCYTCDRPILDQAGNSTGVHKEYMRSDAKSGKILARYAIGLCGLCNWIHRDRR